MGLINCSKCGGQVSSNATRCPHCGIYEFGYKTCDICKQVFPAFEISSHQEECKKQQEIQLREKEHQRLEIVRISQGIPPIEEFSTLQFVCPTCGNSFARKIAPHQLSKLPLEFSTELYGRMTCSQCGDVNCESSLIYPYAACCLCGDVLEPTKSQDLLPYEHISSYKSAAKYQCLAAHPKCVSSFTTLRRKLKDIITYRSSLRETYSSLNARAVKHICASAIISKETLFATIVLFITIYFLFYQAGIGLLLICYIVSFLLKILTSYTNFKERLRKVVVSAKDVKPIEMDVSSDLLLSYDDVEFHRVITDSSWLKIEVSGKFCRKINSPPSLQLKLVMTTEEGSKVKTIFDGEYDLGKSPRLDMSYRGIYPVGFSGSLDVWFSAPNDNLFMNYFGQDAKTLDWSEEISDNEKWFRLVVEEDKLRDREDELIKELGWSRYRLSCDMQNKKLKIV